MNRQDRLKKLVDLRDEFLKQNPQAKKSFEDFLKQYKQFLDMWRKLYPPKRRLVRYRAG